MKRRVKKPAKKRVKRTAQSAAALALAVEVIGVRLVQLRHDGHEQPGAGHDHVPPTHYGTIVATTSAAVFDASSIDLSMFRAYYAQPLETLTDEVSKNLPRASATFYLA